MNIGPLRIDPPLLLAPMAGFSNAAFRQMVCRFGGVGLLTTEMVHARGFLEMERRRKGLSDRLFGLDRPGDTPTAVQIWDNDAQALAETAEKLLRQFPISAIDLNFGCPMEDVTLKADAGAWLLQFPEQMENIVRQVVAAAGSVPVTAKIRLGWSADSLNVLENAQMLEEAGVQALTVHGRTACQMYRGEADWEKIAAVKTVLRKIPLIGNGDLRTPRQAARAFHDYGVDGVMVGREALKRPWFFRQTQLLMAGEPEEVWNFSLTPKEQKALLLEHFRLLLEQHTEQESTMMMRRFAPCYGTGLAYAKRFRVAIATASTAEAFYQVVEEFFPVELHPGYK
ncbi:MAG: tRNA-dihydrouridine synthase [Planctomycetia bacterium]|nr:tRNA-dihydrouridine synthase [Planctomycetia bacterium]